LRDRVDAVGQQLGDIWGRGAEHAGGGQAALLHGGGGEGREADVQRDAADHWPAIDHRRPLPELRGGDGGFLPGGTAADHDQIMVAGKPSSGFGVSLAHRRASGGWQWRLRSVTQLALDSGGYYPRRMREG